MAKNDSLSSDINFIKEFEELKLKQKLLVESLKKKGKSEYEIILTNIDSKLDFLVKIFKEAKQEELKHEEENVENNIANVLASLDELKGSLDEKYGELFSRIAHLETTISGKEVSTFPKLEKVDGLDVSVDKSNVSEDDNKKTGGGSDGDSLGDKEKSDMGKDGVGGSVDKSVASLPPPDFKVNATKVDLIEKKDLPSEEKKKEKKGWFK
ncbi:MAG: hypothetical protein KC589_07320 [Nanoarchaeota archaeon]|nr:hypothetical protein [Nanoarchaeota archaeon]